MIPQGSTLPGHGPALDTRHGKGQAQSHSRAEGRRRLQQHRKRGHTPHGSGVRGPTQPCLEGSASAFRLFRGRRLRARGVPGGATDRPPPHGGAAAAADLQVSDVPVDVHGGRHAVLGHVLVVAGAQLAVHGVDAGDGDSLVAASDVSAPGQGRQPAGGKCCPGHRTGTRTTATRAPLRAGRGGRPVPGRAHLLTVFSAGTGLSGAASCSALLICSALHTWECRLAHCRGVSPSLFFKFTSESRERKRLKGKT